MYINNYVKKRVCERGKERGRERERKRASVLDVETIIELEEADHWVNNK